MHTIEVPESLRREPRWWHDEAGAAWLHGLPALAGRALATWGLVPDGPSRHGANALVIPVLSPGDPAALRLTPPGPRAAAELRALRFWAGGPVVGVLQSSPDGSVLLLERLDPSRSLAGEPVERVAAVAGELVARLALPGPPADVPTTADTARALAATAQARWAALGAPGERRWIEAAVAHAGALPDEDPGLAVNGDVHAEQVLAGGREAWTVIDPVLLGGDPAYDLARVLWTQADRLTDAAAIRALASALVEATGFDEDRTRAWLVVRTVDYLLWGLEQRLTQDPVRCLRLLDALV